MDEAHARRGRAGLVGGVDHLEPGDVEARRVGGGPHQGLRADQDRTGDADLGGLDGTAERRLPDGEDHGGGHRRLVLAATHQVVVAAVVAEDRVERERARGQVGSRSAVVMGPVHVRACSPRSWLVVQARSPGGPRSAPAKLGHRDGCRQTR